MRKIIISIIALCLFETISAQISLAVMDFKPGIGVTDAQVNGLSDMLINSLYDSGNYDIIERGQINHALNELNLQGKSLSVAELTQLGEYLKVNNVLVGTVNFIATGNSADIGFLEGEFNIDVRIVDVKSSKIIATAGETKTNTMSYRDLMPKLAKQLSTKLYKNSIPCLQGYLYVYPEYLGRGSYDIALDKVKHLNAIKSLGRNNWRLPTEDELMMILKEMIEHNKTIFNYDITIPDPDNQSKYGFSYCIWTTTETVLEDRNIAGLIDRDNHVYTRGLSRSNYAWIVLVATD